MTLVTKFESGFVVDDSELGPGDLFRKADASLWIVNPDNSQTQLGVGGSQPGSSYLGTYSAGSTALTGTDAAQAFDSPPDAVLGTDISISEDGKTFTINTDGWYSWVLDSAFNSAGKDAIGQANVQVSAGGLDAGDLYSTMGTFQITVDLAVAANRFKSQQTLPPFNFKAGDTFQVLASATLSAGSATWSGSLTIVRVG